MVKKLFPLVLIGLALGSRAFADDQIQSVQQALKDQGFYYGQVDGEGGPETDAAVRRYQIRNGLEVTGKLNQQTISALHAGGDSSGGGDPNTVEAVPPRRDAPAPSGDDETTATPPPQVVEKDHDFLRRHTNPTPSPDAAEPPAEEVQPDEQAPAPAPLQAPPEAYTGFFRRTPYETAPLAVQRSTVHRAQIKLAREGAFRGIADSQPSQDFSRAIAAYQRAAGIAPSGRLDMETLTALDLLPQRRQVFRDPFPSQDYDEPPPARPVYRGIWVH